MSRFILHTKTKEKKYFTYLAAGIACILLIAAGCCALRGIGTARAKSRETVLIYTEEELEQYLLDKSSEEYNLNGRYRLEEDLELGWISGSIGTNVEPFTGSFDGNGHVISGLERPLFGVLNQATVENLFLSDVVIQHPFTYFDGECYVDGYGALAAYIVDSTVHNCGMGGEIYVATPSEAEYQTAKASPADAEELKGPGYEEAPKSQEESGPEGEAETEGTPGGGAGNNTEEVIQDDTGKEDGDGAGAEESESTQPETESLWETETSVTSQESEDVSADSSEGEENTQETQTAKEDETGQENQTAEETVQEETGQEEEIQTDSNTEAAVPMETVGYQPHERQSLTMKTYAVVDSQVAAVASASGAEQSAEIGPGVEPENPVPFISTPSDADPYDTTVSETVPLETTIFAATPFDANELENQIEYVGNPNGDMFILVTAERIAAGGLVAQTAGKTLISNSFSLVTAASGVTEVDTYAGGFVGILGGETRAENSYASGLVESSGVTGGFAAVNEGTIEHCFSTMTIGENGVSRGAFIAKGDGNLSACAYDRQIACVGEQENQESESTVKGLNTIELIGTQSQMPGTWFTVENAYPQIEYFALHENNRIAVSSKVSAVALVLPEGVRLSDVLKTGELVLPSEIDGQEIRWEAEGQIRIDENNQVLPDENAAISGHEAPRVGSSLESKEEETDESMEKQNIEENPGSSEDSENTGLKLKASMENISKSFGLFTLSKATTYNSWKEVGDGLEEGLRPKQNAEGYYEIFNGAQLAWFACQVNAGQNTLNAKLMDNIDLYGYGVTTPVTPDINDALLWNPIGATEGNPYIGIFDGNSHFVSNLRVEGTNLSNQGFIGNFANPGIVKDFGVASGKVWATYDNVGAVIGNIIDNTAAGNGAQLLRCWNRVDVEGRKVVGGIAGMARNNNLLVEGCYNQGNIKATDRPSGILGQIDVGNNINIKDCYNTGSLTGTRQAGGIVAFLASNVDTLLIENCYNLGNISTSDGSLGGINGWINSSKNVTMRNCYNKGMISGDNCAGGIVASVVTGENLLIEECYNEGDIVATGGRAGGIVAYDERMAGSIYKNCYNLGTITGGSNIGGIAGVLNQNRGSNNKIINCFNAGTSSAGICGYSYGTVTNCYYVSNLSSNKGSGTIAQAQPVTAEQLQSWAAAFALNGQSLVQKDEADEEIGSWTYRPGSLYPEFYNPKDAATEKLAPAKDWEAIGQGIDTQLIGPFESRIAKPGGNGSTESYKLGTAEELAWFAYHVNKTVGAGGSTASGFDADLISDIIFSIGAEYGGTASDPVPWASMKEYSGTFGAGNAKIYTISKLHMESADQAGLFGTVKGSAYISKLGMIQSSITGHTAGGIAAEVAEHAVISRCFNKSAISAPGTDQFYIGGIAGKISGNGRIEDCYNMDATINGTAVGSVECCAGGIAGGIIGSAGRVWSSYSLDSTVSISGAAGKAKTGSIVGFTDTAGCIERCYAVTPGIGSDGANGTSLVSKAEMREQAVTDSLNVSGETGTERLNQSRVWYTSLAGEMTKGFPTFEAPRQLSVELSPAETMEGSTGNLTAESDSLPAGTNVLFRGIRFENSGTTGYALNLMTKSSFTDAKFRSYGLNSAISNLVLMAGTVDLAEIKNQASLSEPKAQLAVFDKMTLYNAAAYLDRNDRTILVDVSHETTRYEIRVKIKAVTSKTLSLIISAGTTIELQPGINRRADSNDVVVTNGNDYPVAGKITAVEVMREQGKMELNPIAPNLSIDDSKRLEEAGVILGITGAKESSETVIGSKEYYYNPVAGEADTPWLSYQLGSKNTFRYRYFMKYSPLYLGEQAAFGYNIQYSAAIPSEDVPAGTAIVTGVEVGNGG